MAESRLKVILQTTGTGKLKAATKSTDRLKVAVVKLNNAFKNTQQEAVKAANKVRNFGRSAGQAASNGVGKLNKALGKFGVVLTGVAVAGGLLQLARNSAKATAELGRLRVALENVAGNDTAQALKIIQGTVDDFNTPITDATRGFTQLAAAGTAAGFSIDELDTVFRGLTAANKALAGDTEQLRGILLATTQVFSKGKVAAEELRGQIGERLPGAFAEFAKATGRSTAELDKALQNGEVSLNDFVLFAERLLQKYEKDAQVIADGPAEAGARLEKELQNLNVAVGGELASLGAKFQDFAANAISALTSVFTYLGTLGREIESRLGGLPADQLERATEGLARANKNLATAKTNLRIAEENQKTFGGFEEDVKRAAEGVKIFTQIAKDNQKIIDGFKYGPELPKPVVPPVVPAATAGGSSSGRTRTSRSKQNLEAERLARTLERQRKELIGIVNASKAAEQSAVQRLITENQLLQIQIKEGEEVADAARQIKALMDEGVDFATAFDLVNTNTQMKQLLNGTEELSNETKVLASVWNGFGQEVTNVFDALIDGTKDWNSVLKDTLRSLSKVLFNAGLNALAGGDGRGFFSALTGGITGKASGGPVSGGTPYVVGEKGPELFTPSTSGTITPNSALGGNTVVNITVNENGGSSSSSQGDRAKEALALGRMVESSVVAILTREKRPGGILTRA